VTEAHACEQLAQGWPLTGSGKFAAKYPCIYGNFYSAGYSLHKVHWKCWIGVAESAGGVRARPVNNKLQ